MPMSVEKTKQVFSRMIEFMQGPRGKPGYEPRLEPKELGPHKKALRYYEVTKDEISSHLIWMCEQGKAFMDQDRREKAMRWLGFIQGYLYHTGDVSIETMKEWNMPDESPVAVLAPSTAGFCPDLYEEGDQHE